MTKDARRRVFVMEAQAKAAIPALEPLARGELFVVAGSEKRQHSGFWSRYCHENQVYPSPRSRKTDFQKWLLDFLARGDSLPAEIDDFCDEFAAWCGTLTLRRTAAGVMICQATTQALAGALGCRASHIVRRFVSREPLDDSPLKTCWWTGAGGVRTEPAQRPNGDSNGSITRAAR